jgi:SAM-dependent methyltransferase
MEREWDQRARLNARHYVATSKECWNDDEFYASGYQTVREQILSDFGNICEGRDPRSMKVLEIGCGAGRVTRALAQVFGEVHAVDISGEMVHLAREAVKPFPNAFVYRNSGMDLSVVPEVSFDFAFSCLVFQHVPSHQIVASYLAEVHRLLRSGALFKFQIQGVPGRSKPADTWTGVSFSDEQIVRLARRCGFDPRYRHGGGTQEFWVWCFKPE